MHEKHEAHERFLRDTIKALGIKEVVYMEDNAYDGGYEVRVGTHDFFVDYEILDEEDAEYIKERMKGYDA
jgi:hypothetical protein